jgi:hypothetical protein
MVSALTLRGDGAQEVEADAQTCSHLRHAPKRPGPLKSPLPHQSQGIFGKIDIPNMMLLPFGTQDHSFAAGLRPAPALRPVLRAANGANSRTKFCWPKATMIWSICNFSRATSDKRESDAVDSNDG